MPEDKAEGARWRSFKGKTAWVTGAGGELIARHGRLLAAKSLDMTEVPTIELVGLNDAQKRALRLADNKIALGAGWDLDLLRVELADLSALDIDLTAIGEIDVLLDSNDDPDDEVIPPAPAEPRTKPGDI